jgi:hypothetical protein
VEAELEEARQEWARALSKLPQADVARHPGITRQAVARTASRLTAPSPLAKPEERHIIPHMGDNFHPPEGGHAIDIGEQRRTIYIEPIEEPTPAAEPVSLLEEPRPIGTPDPEPAR